LLGVRERSRRALEIFRAVDERGGGDKWDGGLPAKTEPLRKYPFGWAPGATNVFQSQKLTRLRSPIFGVPAGDWLNLMKTVNFADFGSDVPAARNKTGTFRAQTLP
jgi:hypothetical protein